MNLIENLPQAPHDPRSGSELGSRKPLTFRNSTIVYYGPHLCENCGVNICKMGREWGGNAFTYPEGPIYPNTEWTPHVCDPKQVRNHCRVKGIPVSD